MDDEASDSEDEDLDDSEPDEDKEKKLSNKVKGLRDKFVNDSGRYMSKRKIKELEDKLYKELRKRMEEEKRDRDKRREMREKKRVEREKRKDKMRMLRKSTSGTMYYNLIERIDLENPYEWEYVNIKTCELKNHSQLGMLELSNYAILVFGGATPKNEHINIKNSYI